MNSQNVELNATQQEIMRLLQQAYEEKIADSIKLSTVLNLIQINSDAPESHKILEIEEAIKALRKLNLIEICHPSLRWVSPSEIEGIINGLSISEEIKWDSDRKCWTQEEFEGNPGWFLMLEQITLDTILSSKPLLSKMI